MLFSNLVLSVTNNDGALITIRRHTIDHSIVADAVYVPLPESELKKARKAFLRAERAVKAALK